ncbi:DUF6233 domain-containing protein [Streptomyces mirabilis]|uniref:DUF6233 domain-containing protein n=1 Tax=Streptomyces mirabilis TaxID=68239 RepID=UPI0036DB347C
MVELGIGNGRPPIEVHVGACYAAGKRRRPVPRDEARRLLTSGVRACTHCKPSTGVKTKALVHFLWCDHTLLQPVCRKGLRPPLWASLPGRRWGRCRRWDSSRAASA